MKSHPIPTLDRVHSKASRPLERVAWLCMASLLFACSSTRSERLPCPPGDCVMDAAGEVNEAGMSQERAMLCSDGVTYVVDENPLRPFVRYMDGQVSLSNTCAVRVDNKLNRKVPPAYINGQPLGFC